MTIQWYWARLTVKSFTSAFKGLTMPNHPMASDGLITYRYRGRYGFIYIGASTDTEALSEAQRSTDDKVTPDRLERWNGQHYAGVLS